VTKNHEMTEWKKQRVRKLNYMLMCNEERTGVLQSACVWTAIWGTSAESLPESSNQSLWSPGPQPGVGNRGIALPEIFKNMFSCQE